MSERINVLFVCGRRVRRAGCATGLWSINEATFDLSVKNPNVKEEAPPRRPDEIIAEIPELDAESERVLESTSKLL